MNDITLQGCQPNVLLSHLALYGLAAILESAGVPALRAGWKEGGSPRPYLSGTGLDDVAVGTLIAEHARSADADGSWLHRDMTVNGSARAVMSPRLSIFDTDTWPRAQRARQDILDDLTDGRRWLDLRLLGSLGEPCYWRTNRQGAILQDDAASRLEMQPRNQGSEFVGNRLRKLAAAVAARTPMEIVSGLRGDLVRDEIGSDRSDSRTPTGLASPGPTDNALAWCALWGISQFPIAMRVASRAVTSGHYAVGRHEWFYVPIWRGEWQPARIRSILASDQLRAAAVTEADAQPGLESSAAQGWLSARGVEGVVRFPIAKFGSDNAPERRAMSGEPIPVTARA